MENTNICQSCAMPLSDEVLATNADGSHNSDYCVYCFKDGAFTWPEATMDAMIDQCVPHMAPMSPADARNLMTQALPQLKRWKS